MTDIQSNIHSTQEDFSHSISSGGEFDNLDKANQLTPIAAGKSSIQSEIATSEILATLRKSKEGKIFSPSKLHLSEGLMSTPSNDENKQPPSNLTTKLEAAASSEGHSTTKTPFSVSRLNATPAKSILKTSTAYKANSPNKNEPSSISSKLSKRSLKSPRHPVVGTPSSRFKSSLRTSPQKSWTPRSPTSALSAKHISFVDHNDDDDDNYIDDNTQKEIEKELSSSRKRRSEEEDLKQQVIKQRRSDHSTLHKILTDPAVPYVLSLYLQLFFNILILSIVGYFVYSFVRTIQADVENKIEGYASDVLQEISLCSREYIRNNCQPGLRVPAMESSCMSWEKCMNRDPASVGRARIGAETFAEIINGFIKPISWKSIFTILLITVGSLVFTNTAFGTYRNFSIDHNKDRHHQQYPSNSAPINSLNSANYQTPMITNQEVDNRQIAYTPNRDSSPRRLNDNNNTNNSMYFTPIGDSGDYFDDDQRNTTVFETPDTEFRYLQSNRLSNSELRLNPPSGNTYTTSPLAGRRHQPIDRY